MLRRIVFALVSAAISLALFVAVAEAESCPNDQLRQENGSTGLPECRAYEMVSPVDKNNVSIAGITGYTQSALNGETVTFIAGGGFAGSQGFLKYGQFLADRDVSGWTTRGVSLPQPPTTSATFFNASEYWALSEDLSHGVSSGFGFAPFLEGSEEFSNLYLVNDATSGYTKLASSPTARITTPFVAGTENFDHVAFNSLDSQNEQAAPGVENAYEESGGTVRLAGVLPGGGVDPGGSAIGPSGEAGFGYYAKNAISADGSHVFFTSPAAAGQVYVRIDGRETVEVSTSQRNPVDPNGTQPAKFQMASKDGSSVLFTSTEELTDDADTSNGPNLYRYDIGSGTLSDLTAASHADVTGVIGASDDLSRIYYTTSPGVSVWDNGEIRTVTPQDISDGEPDPPTYNDGVAGDQRARVSANGRYLLLETASELTSYNTAGHTEIYRYDADSGELSCASCSSEHSASTQSATELATVFGPWTGVSYLPRSLLNDGTVFYMTAEALVPQDTNGQSDVYEWTGVGDPRLISSGQGDNPATFADASPDGRDVFFTTRNSLVAADVDENTDLYDARVDGGFKAPIESPAPCAGDNCQGPASGAPSLPVPATLTPIGEAAPPPAEPRPAVATALKVLKVRVISATSALLETQVSGSGELKASGAGLKNATARSSSASTIGIRLTITAKAKVEVLKRGKIQIKVRLTFKPATNSSSRTSMITVTFRRATRTGATRRPSSKPARSSGGSL